MNIFIYSKGKIFKVKMETFFCRSCSSDVVSTEWYYSVRGRDGMCKTCRKNYRKPQKREYTKKYISTRKEHYKQLMSEWRKNNPDYQRKWSKDCPESQLLRSARLRAKKKNMECTITQNDIHIPDECPVFKRPFVKGTEYGASLDRIDNTKGYIPGNVVVVSRKANVMKNNGTVQDIRMLLEYYSELS